MAKLKKESSSTKKEKKVIMGKILKTIKNKEVPMVQVKLRAHKENFENPSLATPLPKNSRLKYTSTPLNVGDATSNRRVARLTLSPICKNVEDNPNIKTIRSRSIPELKENLPESHGVSVKPQIKDKSARLVKKSVKNSNSEKTGRLPVKENIENALRQPRVRICRINTTVKTISSDSSSSKQKNTNAPKRRTVSQGLDSTNSSINNTNSQYRQNAEKSQSSAVKNNSLVRHLRSDWSSTTFEEETAGESQNLPTTSQRKETNDVRHQVRENNCSKLRVRLRRSHIKTNSSSEPPSINANPKQKKFGNVESGLKSEDSDKTIGQTSTQIRCLNKNQTQSKPATKKRKLTTLIEVSLEDTNISPEKSTDTSNNAERTESNTNEDEYSSSAEFQSDDESNNQSRSKRAPTWKDLSNKTSNQEPVARRSRRLNSEIGKSVSPTAGKKVPKTQMKDDRKTSGAVSQLESSSELSSIEINNQGSTKEVEKQHDNVLSKQNHDNKEQKQHLEQESKLCEESVAAPSSDHNNLQETNFDKNTSSSPKNNDDTEKCKTIDLTCPVKFFQSRLENPCSQSKSQQASKRPRSSRRKKQESIYEFLSQSSSESNNPVDDVIQKMIKTGKAVVAKHKKGTGKNILPRNRAPAKTQRKKQAKTEEIIPTKPTKPLAEKLPTQNKKQPEFEKPPIPAKKQDDPEYGLQFDDDDFHFDNVDIDTSEEDQVRDQRGFSNLARSAMIKQAGRIQKPLQRKPITDKKKLLAMAMQFVSQSTPIRNTPQHMNAPQFSPLPGNKSPWRVTDDKLPNLFYLGRDSNNLPSFSSDYIPMTPSKNKSKSLSSFSSNDSNGENQAPAGAKVVTNEANLQALTNTRKALSYRSPLKAINIIDVVNLPPLALHSYGTKSNDENASKNNSKETNHNSINKTARNILRSVISHHSKNKSNNNSENSTNSSHQSSNHSNQSDRTQNQSLRNSMNDLENNNNKTDLFGFEELIDDSEIDSTNISVDKTILPNKNVLKEKLQRLKQLRPKNTVIISNKRERIKPIFDDVVPQQKTLKQMLCSTMIDKNQDNCGVGNRNLDETDNLSNLFKDIEPETTFDDSLPRRTYNRQFKRKRKVLSNYATIMDSDASEHEEEGEKRPVKHYKAKPNKRNKIDTELKKFVNEFNEMCKEVSQYELIVE